MYNNLYSHIDLDFNEPQEMVEYICDPKNEQHGYYPRKHPILDKMCNDANAAFWPASEVRFVDDYNDFKTLTEDEQRVVMKVQMFFSQGDGLIMKTVNTNFANVITIREALDFIAIQNHVEQVHNQTYGNVINVLCEGNDELRDRIRNAIDNFPEIRKISGWYNKWITIDCSFAHKLFAQILSEGLFFQGAFVIIFWIRQYKPGKLKGVTNANRLISIDEKLHSEFYTELYNMLFEKLPVETAYEIIDEAVGYSIEFTNVALEAPIIGLNANSMSDYIKSVADSWLVQCGYPPKYNVQNPYGWLVMMACEEKSNMHDAHPKAYNDRPDMTIGTISDDF